MFCLYIITKNMIPDEDGLNMKSSSTEERERERQWLVS